MRKIIFLAVFVGAFTVMTAYTSPAEAKVTISRNGFGSRNRVHMGRSTRSIRLQINLAHVENTANVHGTTGDNTASGNTGGNTDVKTGDADATVYVKSNVNDNLDANPDCGCVENPAPEVVITKNGARSKNSVHLHSRRTSFRLQGNGAHVTNDVTVGGSTGRNTSNNNTGGDVSVDTGDQTAEVTVKNNINYNTMGMMP